MDVFLLRVFQTQVALQCQFMLVAAEDANNAIQKGNVLGTFFALQNMLNAGANISKALWGQGGKLSAERKPLRDSIGIDDNSPLRNVTMRNNFEHFDERLDRWWKESKRHNHIDLSIGPSEAIMGVDTIDLFRTFNPATTDMSFWGQEFNIKSLIDEVVAILPKAEAEASKPHWEEDQPNLGT